MIQPTRTKILLLFFVCLGVAFWRASSQVNSGEDSELRRYSEARGPLRELLNQSGEMFSQVQKRTLRDSVQQLSLAFSVWGIGRGDPAAERAVRLSCQPAMARILSVLDSSSSVERLWIRAGQQVFERAIQRRWPLGRGVLVLRVGQAGSEADVVPQFVYADFDLSSAATPVVRIRHARTAFAIVRFENAKPGANHVPMRLISDGREIANLSFTIDVPPAGQLRVSVIDAETGKPTAAVVGLYAPDHELAVPPQAISFDGGGFAYRPGRMRPYQSSHYWPGNADERRVFFVDGQFSLALPAGDYRLIVGKGFEYVPLVQSVRVEPASAATRTVTLKRWINMPARGWYSGDGHVHYARAGEEANQRLLTWARAEDVHMINVMRMGDALQTYFEQYAYGKAGRKISLDYALVPGQEDPRTSYIGHTLQMNIQAPVHKPDQYYLYDEVFDQIHRQGGLTGYAHVYQPPNMGFWVRNDMTVNIPKHKVDFAEICEFGDVDEHLYYEFLNLGFKVTATAGSDVPWGNSIGTSRVYAYTGKRFDPDAWFRAVKEGRTFVTTGPMLELTVNDQLPGAEIAARPGEVLHIKATASGGPVLPHYVEVVEQGETVHAAESGQKSISVEFTFRVRHSTWLAARCAGARTSPVYVRVGDEPFWKLPAVPELVAERLKQLHDIEELTRQGVGRGNEGGWNNPEGFQKMIPQLLERVEAARRIYVDMLQRAKAELQRSGEAGN